MILALDLIGIFVFALSGATLAIRKRLDLFGVLVLALAAALAGGVMRDMAIGAVPPAALTNAAYLIVALVAGFVAFFAHRWIERVDKPVMLLDAAGLGLFAVAGCRKALEYGLEPVPAILLGMVTAIGGGVVRDILVAEVPRVLREEIYAVAALLGAGIVALGWLAGLPQGLVDLAAAGSAFALRVLSVWRGWSAPRAPGS